MTQVKETIHNLSRFVLAIMLCLVYLLVKTAHALNIVAYDQGFLLDTRIGFWLGVFILAGAETFRNALAIWNEYQDKRSPNVQTIKKDADNNA